MLRNQFDDAAELICRGLRIQIAQCRIVLQCKANRIEYGYFIGTAPATKAGVALGRHRLNVSAPGYDAVSEDLEVAAGPREVAISLKEVRLSASIAVTHKHGIGSCKGTLKASPQGLVYETDHTGDAFSVAMADIETFEVDYLAKNLKLKVKKGKTWNFADPDGNADRLFIFHRDVDKARQRLIAK